MVQIIWTTQARKDLQDIHQYISKDSGKYAKAQVLKLKQRTMVLKAFPKTGRIVPELEQESVRELIEGNYRIVYQIVDVTKIAIISIHHSAREFNS